MYYQAIVDESASLQQKMPMGAVPLMDCIHKFCEVETLSEDDPWFCPKCKVRILHV